MIKITGLKKYYGGRQILNIPDLKLDKGKLHMVIGPNGSGKTTLLKLISGIEKDYEGTILSQYSGQNTVLCLQNPWMFSGKVSDNIKMGFKLRKQKANKSIIDKYCKKLGLEKLLDLNANKLSAGEKQRVSLSRALVLEPKLLLLDEPGANLDSESLEQIENTVLDLKGNGTTVIMASHLLEQAYRLQAELVRLESGCLAPAEIANVFKGKIVKEQSNYFVKILEDIKIMITASKQGDVQIAVSPHDVILSKEGLDSSLRNTFSGTITDLITKDNNIVEVTIDIGVKFRAVITAASASTMGLTLGLPIFISFKATAVKVF